MATSYYLGIDQGTTGCTAILFDESWKPAAKGYREIKQIYPKAGWVEHEPSDVWNSILGSVMETTSKVNAPTVNIRCIGIDHEGESVIAWDLFQVLRHQLGWDMGEQYSLTLPVSEQPPAKIERSEPK